MDALGLEKASFVGNSMGGATALSVAVDFPDRVDKLVLMGSGSGGGANIFSQSPTEGSKVLNEVFDNPSVEGFRKLINIMLYDGSQVPDEVLEQRYQATVGNMAHVEARAKSSTAMRDISAQIPGITAPTLIVHGLQDRVVPFENSPATASRDSELAVGGLPALRTLGAVRARGGVQPHRAGLPGQQLRGSARERPTSRPYKRPPTPFVSHGRDRFQTCPYHVARDAAVFVRG